MVKVYKIDHYDEKENREICVTDKYRNGTHFKVVDRFLYIYNKDSTAIAVYNHFEYARLAEEE